ncbi:hypothetical protein [Nostoc sp. UHCC 0870]|uniref:hypothetical protein n=1 Tax=Nostoc sp. UHCC 0870 TaxID=2914041 RepID=UPI001EE034E8|nr:hypothetical protein [Nostoc sp. UHCC 0870]UKO97963.1 hypothetical protein L6494_26005 [Nostoc sp. UHCC 0870]
MLTNVGFHASTQPTYFDFLALTEPYWVKSHAANSTFNSAFFMIFLAVLIEI